MSNASYTGGSGDNDSGAQENPLAVWLRNVPTWLDEDRSETVGIFLYLKTNNFLVVFTPRLENGLMWTKTNRIVSRISRTAPGLE